MDANTARAGYLLLGALAVGGWLVTVYERHMTCVQVRNAHAEMVRIATEQDIARRIDG